MKLKDQVVSLELAKRLKELSVKQDAFNSWYWSRPYNEWLIVPTHLFEEMGEHYSAFTVAELGEILPNFIYTEKVHNKEWWCRGGEQLGIDATTEADARAKMLIYLIVTGKEIKE